MINYYLDSSAWIKVYITEAGTPWITTVFNAGVSSGKPLFQLSSASIAMVEVAAAIARHERSGKIALPQRLELYRRLIYDCENRTSQLGLSKDILRLAAELTQRRPLRGYDAIHLATALTLNRHFTATELPPITFISADAILCATAVAEGLSADNPNDHV